MCSGIYGSSELSRDALIYKDKLFTVSLMLCQLSRIVGVSPLWPVSC